MARQLRAAGEEVQILALIDPAPLPRWPVAAEMETGMEGGDPKLQVQFLRDLVALSGNGAAVPGGSGMAQPDCGSQATLAGDPPGIGAGISRRLDLTLPLPRLVHAAQAAGLLPPALGPL